MAPGSQASCSPLLEGPDSFGSGTADRFSFSGFACCFHDYFVETGMCVADPLTAVPGRCRGSAPTQQLRAADGLLLPCWPARVFTGFVCCLY